MNTRLPPEVWVLIALILVMMPVSAGLLVKYFSGTNLSSGQGSTPLPETGQLRQMLEEIVQNREVSIVLVYDHIPETATGIARVYDVQDGQTLLYKLVVFRHDIDCSVCKDIMAVAVYSPAEKKLVKVFLGESWEVHDKRVDTRGFLAQFEGRPLSTSMQMGATVDGITGATKSASALVERLNEAALWVIEHKEKERPWKTSDEYGK